MPIVDCNCTTTNLTKIESTRCGENMGQIQLLAFEKLSDKQASLSTLANIAVKTNWTAAMNNGATIGKIQITPEVKGWDQSGGDPVLWGEDVKANSMPEKVRDNPVQITVSFRGAKAAVASAINDLRCLATNGDLGVYLFPTDSYVIGVDNTTTLDSFPVGYSNMAPRVIGAKDEPDTDSFTFYIDANDWRKMKKVALDHTAGSTAGAWRGIDLLAVS